ncbi:MAG: LpqB family beta-propeller domain-containing protein [Microbacteriaceae bacterium]
MTCHPGAQARVFCAYLRVSAAAIGLTLVLAACGGLPTAGSVNSGSQINDNVQLDIGFAPQGPVPGAAPVEIMQDFILAATNPQSDYAVARQFLASTFSAEWNPDEVVLIRSGNPSTTIVSETAIDYSFPTKASVGSNGRYLEAVDAETARQSFTFVQEQGEWRIASAPPGIVLSTDSFGKVFTQRALYFFDPTYQYLVPDVRWFPNRPGVNVRVAASLLEGPASWLGQGVLISEFPEGTTLGDELVTIESGIGSVDLSQEARDTSGIQRERMRQQLSASLGSVASVVMSINGAPLPVADSTTSAAVTNPTVEPLLLVGRDGQFGFVANDEIAPIDGLSVAVTKSEPLGATLSRGKSAAAVLGARGVFVVRSGSEAPTLLDSRAGLIAPSIDGSGFIWSAPAARATALVTFDLDGGIHPVSTGLADDARLVSVDVSRDGTRILLYLSTPSGPQLVVAGVIRQDFVPVSLGELVFLPVGQGVPVDAAWVDDHTIATLSDLNGSTEVKAFVVGGPQSELGTLEGGRTITGGNGGVDGVRVLDDDGNVLRSRGAGWQETGITAEFVATQQ